MFLHKKEAGDVIRESRTDGSVMERLNTLSRSLAEHEDLWTLILEDTTEEKNIGKPVFDYFSLKVLLERFFAMHEQWHTALHKLVLNEKLMDRAQQADYPFVFWSSRGRDKINAVIDDMDKAESYRKDLARIDGERSAIGRLCKYASLLKDLFSMLSYWRSEVMYICYLETESRRHFYNPEVIATKRLERLANLTEVYNELLN